MKLETKILAEIIFEYLADEAFCVKYILKQLNDKVRNCSCEVDCIEQQYDVFTSQTRWPSEKFAVIQCENIMILLYFLIR